MCFGYRNTPGAAGKPTFTIVGPFAETICDSFGEFLALLIRERSGPEGEEQLGMT